MLTFCLLIQSCGDRSMHLLHNLTQTKGVTDSLWTVSWWFGLIVSLTGELSEEFAVQSVLSPSISLGSFISLLWDFFYSSAPLPSPHLSLFSPLSSSVCFSLKVGGTSHFPVQHCDWAKLWLRPDRSPDPRGGGPAQCDWLWTVRQGWQLCC